MKRILLIFTFTLFAFSTLHAQSRTNTLTRPCPAGTSPTKATVSVAAGGAVTVAPCATKDTTITGDAEVTGVLTVGSCVGCGGGSSAKVYRALLTQTGTDAPTVTVFENTLSGALVWTRNSTGVYYGTLVGEFPVAKTYISNGFTWIRQFYDDDFTKIIKIYRGSNDLIVVQQREGFAGTPPPFIDQITAGLFIEIIVYP